MLKFLVRSCAQIALVTVLAVLMLMQLVFTAIGVELDKAYQGQLLQQGVASVYVTPTLEEDPTFSIDLSEEVILAIPLIGRDSYLVSGHSVSGLWKGSNWELGLKPGDFAEMVVIKGDLYAEVHRYGEVGLETVLLSKTVDH